jgi:hypothetical protein
MCVCGMCVRGKILCTKESFFFLISQRYPPFEKLKTLHTLNENKALPVFTLEVIVELLQGIDMV